MKDADRIFLGGGALGVALGAFVATTVMRGLNEDWRSEVCKGKLVAAAQSAQFNLSAGGRVTPDYFGSECTYTAPNGTKLTYPAIGPNAVPLSDAKTADPYLKGP